MHKDHKGMGFTAAAQNIQEREDVSSTVARAILASASRKNKGGPNKNLNKVKGK